MNGSNERIVVLSENRENRRLLAEALARDFTVVADGSIPLDGDCYLVDALSLHRQTERLTTVRAASEPVLVPVLLLVDRRDVTLGSQGLWQAVDDVLVRPLERRELRARLEVHLRARRLSLALRRLSGLYEQERRIAERFQAAALPQVLPNVPGLTFSASYEPGSDEAKVGGDWYDAYRLLDGQLVVTVGDVGGHGLEAAVVMSEIRQVLRGVSHINPAPETMLAAADRLLQSQHPNVIVTAFVGVLDPVTSLFTYATAGHPRPILRRSSGRLQELVADGLALGVAPAPRRTSVVVALPRGSLVAFYSDGLVEATREPQAGEALLHRALAGDDIPSSGNPARALHDAVVAGRAPDDVAVLVLHLVDPAASLRLETRTTRWSFDVRDAARARRVRQLVVAGLAAAGVSAADRAAAELVYGELVGNVVRHASGSVEVALDWSGDTPILHVLDRGPGFRYLPRLPADIYSERGRGLFLIASLTNEFTVAPRPEGGSHARAVLSLADSRRSLVGLRSDERHETSLEA